MSASHQETQHQFSETSHQNGGVDHASVKNLVNKFDKGVKLQDDTHQFGGQQLQQTSSSHTNVTTTTSSNTGSATAVGVSQSELIDFESAEEHERRARELREKALTTLKTNEEEFSQAEMAQNAARIAAERANMKTQQALGNQERGQQLLAEAGARLIEAGAKLQQEAAAIKREVPYNIHNQAEIRQTTCVSAAGIEAAAHAHEVSTFREVEQLPQPIIQSQNDLEIHY